MTLTACNYKLSEETTITYNSIEEASEHTGESISSIKRKCNSKKCDEWVWANEHIARAHRASKSRKKGNNFELQIIHELIDLGYKGLVSSRSESKNLDNNKIDIAETEDTLPCYIQCKATANTPNIEAISSECNKKDRPLIVMWKKQNSTKKKHDYVIMPKDFFYQLLSNMKDKV